ncbi:glycerate kinase [Proteinivorax tanatarense]|uniref:Glycerate kinase n=1 Tax=Proteinivorax tanatarense TaxID=1260629 RepID=A0AAU7VJF8_9FIRM
MKIGVACDSFKGTFSSAEVADYIEKVAIHYFEEIDVVKIPIADGGEGTVDTLLHFLEGETVYQNVRNPLGQIVTAKYAYFQNEKTAIIEMAQASGLSTIEREKRNPLKTTSFGTGQLINNALEKGAQKIILGLGGSATNDGGLGAVAALGGKFFDKTSNELTSYCGEMLNKVTKISMENINPKMFDCRIILMCDVDNLLLGKHGATYVFGPQKGAKVDELNYLEEGMKKYSKVLERHANLKVSAIEGSGAAGGLAAAMLALFECEVKSGINTSLDLINFEEQIKGCKFVITGEGKMDSQTFGGKVPYGVAKRCKEMKVPVIGFVGALEMCSERKAFPEEIYTVFPLVSDFVDFETIQNNSEKFLLDSLHRMFRLIKVGQNLKN